MALGCCCLSELPCSEGHHPLCPLPSIPPHLPTLRYHPWTQIELAFPKRIEVGGEQGKADEQAPVTLQRMECPRGHVALAPHLGCTSGQ